MKARANSCGLIFEVAESRRALKSLFKTAAEAIARRADPATAHLGKVLWGRKASMDPLRKGEGAGRLEGEGGRDGGMRREGRVRGEGTGSGGRAETAEA